MADFPSNLFLRLLDISGVKSLAVCLACLIIFGIGILDFPVAFDGVPDWMSFAVLSLAILSGLIAIFAFLSHLWRGVIWLNDWRLEGKKISSNADRIYPEERELLEILVANNRKDFIYPIGAKQEPVDSLSQRGFLFSTGRVGDGWRYEFPDRVWSILQKKFKKKK